MNSNALYKLTNLLPQQINLYGFITDNEYRISDILNHLKSTGSQSDINDLTADEVKELILNHKVNL